MGVEVDYKGGFAVEDRIAVGIVDRRENGLLRLLDGAMGEACVGELGDWGMPSLLLRIQDPDHPRLYVWTDVIYGNYLCIHTVRYEEYVGVGQ